MQKITALILAAGEGKRMKTRKSKVLHEIIGKPIIEYVYESVKSADIDSCVCIVGNKAEQIKTYMGDRMTYFMQEQQLGTGHAVAQAEGYLKDESDYVVVLCGDTPLIKSNTIKKALNLHIERGYVATIITTDMENPFGYGRIKRDEQGNVLKIIEQKDTNDLEKTIKEINSGMYCFTTKYLLEALKTINNNNSQGEYYLTDTIEILIKKDLKVGALKVEDSNEVLGINDRLQLNSASDILKKQIVFMHMRNGVTFIDTNSVMVSLEAKIGMDTIIYPGCIIEGNSIIGENCIIGPNTNIINAKIGNNTKVNNSVLRNCEVDADLIIGPYVHINE